jgi:hypothetical protein
MSTFQVADAPIIRPGCRVGVDDAGEHTAGVQQVRYGAERCRYTYVTWCGGIQVGPGRCYERTRTIGQDDNQIELAVAPHPAKQRQRLAFQRVAGSNDGDFGRIALEVGSVKPFRSTLFPTTSYSERYDDIPTNDGSCCTWSAG